MVKKKLNQEFLTDNYSDFISNLVSIKWHLTLNLCYSDTQVEKRDFSFTFNTLTYPTTSRQVSLLSPYIFLFMSWKRYKLYLASIGLQSTRKCEVNKCQSNSVFIALYSTDFVHVSLHSAKWMLDHSFYMSQYRPMCKKQIASSLFWTFSSSFMTTTLMLFPGSHFYQFFFSPLIIKSDVLLFKAGEKGGVELETCCWM